MQSLSNTRQRLQHPSPLTATPGHTPSNLDRAEKKALSKFSQAWKAALKEPNDGRALEDFWGALTKNFELPRDHPDVQVALADCLRAGFQRWGQGDGAPDFAIQLGENIKKMYLDLSLLSFDQISFLSNLFSEQMLAPVPPVDRRDRSGGPARPPLVIGYASELHRALPSEAKRRLEADIANFAVRASASDRSVWEKDVVEQVLKALDCISDPELQMSVAVDLLASTFPRNPNMTMPDNLGFHWASKKIIARAPDFTPQQLMIPTDRMSRLIEQTTDARLLRQKRFDIFQRSYLLQACVSTLRLCANPVEFAPRLMPALLHEVHHYFPESVGFLAAAVSRPDHGDVQVGVTLHTYLAALDDRNLRDLAPGDQISLAVMSFHMDSGDRPYYRAEEHDLPEPSATDRTTRIEYPEWLFKMRAMLSEIWAERAGTQDADLQALVRAALLPAMQGSISPTAISDFAPGGQFEKLTRGILQPSVGPQVRLADWPALQEALHARMNA